MRNNLFLCRRATTVVVLICFIFTQVFFPTYSQAQAPAIVSEPNAGAGLSLKLQIPKTIGNIDEIFLPSERALQNRLIVFIQDAHSNTEAQKSIEGILGQLNSSFGPSLVALEGAEGPLSAENLEIFSDAELNKTVLEALFKKGELTGAEMYMVKHPKEGKFYGVDDIELYRKNLEAYRKVYQLRPETLEWLTNLRSDLKDLTKRVFPNEIKKFDKAREAYQSEVMSTYDYLVFLAKWALEKGVIDINDPVEQLNFPVLTRVLALKRIAAKEQFSTKLKEEISSLKQELKARQVSADVIGVLENFPDTLPAGGSRSFFERLFVESLKSNRPIDWKKYSAFRAFSEYSILQEEIDGVRFFSEIRGLEDLIIKSLGLTEKEMTLLDLSQDSVLLEKIFRLEASKEDVSWFNENEKELTPDQIDARLGNIINEFNNFKRRADRKPADSKAVLDAMKDVKTFYGLAIQRDAALLNNTLALMDKENNSRVILISGGYHSQGIRQLLREKQIPYIFVSPKIQTEFGTEKYERVLMGELATSKSKARSFQKMVVAILAQGNRENLNRQDPEFEQRALGVDGTIIPIVTDKYRSNIPLFDQSLKQLSDWWVNANNGILVYQKGLQVMAVGENRGYRYRLTPVAEPLRVDELAAARKAAPVSLAASLGTTTDDVLTANKDIVARVGGAEAVRGIISDAVVALYDLDFTRNEIVSELTGALKIHYPVHAIQNINDLRSVVSTTVKKQIHLQTVEWAYQVRKNNWTLISSLPESDVAATLDTIAGAVLRLHEKGLDKEAIVAALNDGLRSEQSKIKTLDDFDAVLQKIIERVTARSLGKNLAEEQAALKQRSTALAPRLLEANRWVTGAAKISDTEARDIFKKNVFLLALSLPDEQIIDLIQSGLKAEKENISNEVSLNSVLASIVLSAQTPGVAGASLGVEEAAKAFASVGLTSGDVYRRADEYLNQDFGRDFDPMIEARLADTLILNSFNLFAYDSAVLERNQKNAGAFLKGVAAEMKKMEAAAEPGSREGVPAKGSPYVATGMFIGGWELKSNGTQVLITITPEKGEGAAVTIYETGAITIQKAGEAPSVLSGEELKEVVNYLDDHMGVLVDMLEGSDMPGAESHVKIARIAQWYLADPATKMKIRKALYDYDVLKPHKQRNDALIYLVQNESFTMHALDEFIRTNPFLTKNSLDRIAALKTAIAESLGNNIDQLAQEMVNWGVSQEDIKRTVLAAAGGSIHIPVKIREFFDFYKITYEDPSALEIIKRAKSIIEAQEAEATTKGKILEPRVRPVAKLLAQAFDSVTQREEDDVIRIYFDSLFKEKSKRVYTPDLESFYDMMDAINMRIGQLVEGIQVINPVTQKPEQINKINAGDVRRYVDYLRDVRRRESRAKALGTTGQSLGMTRREALMGALGLGVGALATAAWYSIPTSQPTPAPAPAVPITATIVTTDDIDSLARTIREEFAPDTTGKTTYEPAKINEMVFRVEQSMRLKYGKSYEDTARTVDQVNTIAKMFQLDTEDQFTKPADVNWYANDQKALNEYPKWGNLILNFFWRWQVRAAARAYEKDLTDAGQESYWANRAYPEFSLSPVVSAFAFRGQSLGTVQIVSAAPLTEWSKKEAIDKALLKLNIPHASLETLLRSSVAMTNGEVQQLVDDLANKSFGKLPADLHQALSGVYLEYPWLTPYHIRDLVYAVRGASGAVEQELLINYIIKAERSVIGPRIQSAGPRWIDHDTQQRVNNLLLSLNAKGIAPSLLKPIVEAASKVFGYSDDYPKHLQEMRDYYGKLETASLDGLDSSFKEALLRDKEVKSLVEGLVGELRNKLEYGPNMFLAREEGVNLVAYLLQAEVKPAGGASLGAGASAGEGPVISETDYRRILYVKGGWGLTYLGRGLRVQFSRDWPALYVSADVAGDKIVSIRKYDDTLFIAYVEDWNGVRLAAKEISRALTPGIFPGSLYERGIRAGDDEVLKALLERMVQAIKEGKEPNEVVEVLAHSLTEDEINRWRELLQYSRDFGGMYEARLISPQEERTLRTKTPEMIERIMEHLLSLRNVPHQVPKVEADRQRIIPKNLMTLRKIYEEMTGKGPELSAIQRPEGVLGLSLGAAAKRVKLYDLSTEPPVTSAADLMRRLIENGAIKVYEGSILEELKSEKAETSARKGFKEIFSNQPTFRETQIRLELDPEKFPMFKGQVVTASVESVFETLTDTQGRLRGQLENRMTRRQVMKGGAAAGVVALLSAIGISLSFGEPESPALHVRLPKIYMPALEGEKTYSYLEMNELELLVSQKVGKNPNGDFDHNDVLKVADIFGLRKTGEYFPPFESEFYSSIDGKHFYPDLRSLIVNFFWRYQVRELAAKYGARLSSPGEESYYAERAQKANSLKAVLNEGGFQSHATNTEAIKGLSLGEKLVEVLKTGKTEVQRSLILGIGISPASVQTAVLVWLKKGGSRFQANNVSADIKGQELILRAGGVDAGNALDLLTKSLEQKGMVATALSLGNANDKAQQIITRLSELAKEPSDEARMLAEEVVISLVKAANDQEKIDIVKALDARMKKEGTKLEELPLISSIATNLMEGIQGTNDAANEARQAVAKLMRQVIWTMGAMQRMLAKQTDATDLKLRLAKPEDTAKIAELQKTKTGLVDTANWLSDLMRVELPVMIKLVLKAFETMKGNLGTARAAKSELIKTLVAVPDMDWHFQGDLTMLLGLLRNLPAIPQPILKKVEALAGSDDQLPEVQALAASIYKQFTGKEYKLEVRPVSFARKALQVAKVAAVAVGFVGLFGIGAQIPALAAGLPSGGVQFEPVETAGPGAVDIRENPVDLITNPDHDSTINFTLHKFKVKVDGVEMSVEEYINQYGEEGVIGIRTVGVDNTGKPNGWETIYGFVKMTRANLQYSIENGGLPVGIRDKKGNKPPQEMGAVFYVSIDTNGAPPPAPLLGKGLTVVLDKNGQPYEEKLGEAIIGGPSELENQLGKVVLPPPLQEQVVPGKSTSRILFDVSGIDVQKCLTLDPTTGKQVLVLMLRCQVAKAPTGMKSLKVARYTPDGASAKAPFFKYVQIDPAQIQDGQVWATVEWGEDITNHFLNPQTIGGKLVAAFNVDGVTVGVAGAFKDASLALSKKAIKFDGDRKSPNNRVVFNAVTPTGVTYPVVVNPSEGVTLVVNNGRPQKLLGLGLSGTVPTGLVLSQDPALQMVDGFPVHEVIIKRDGTTTGFQLQSEDWSTPDKVETANYKANNPGEFVVAVKVQTDSPTVYVMGTMTDATGKTTAFKEDISQYKDQLIRLGFVWAEGQPANPETMYVSNVTFVDKNGLPIDGKVWFAASATTDARVAPLLPDATNPELTAIAGENPQQSVSSGSDAQGPYSALTNNSNLNHRLSFTFRTPAATTTNPNPVQSGTVSFKTAADLTNGGANTAVVFGINAAGTDTVYLQFQDNFNKYSTPIPVNVTAGEQRYSIPIDTLRALGLDPTQILAITVQVQGGSKSGSVDLYYSIQAPREVQPDATVQNPTVIMGNPIAGSSPNVTINKALSTPNRIVFQYANNDSVDAAAEVYYTFDIPTTTNTERGDISYLGANGFLRVQFEATETGVAEFFINDGSGRVIQPIPLTGVDGTNKSYLIPMAWLTGVSTDQLNALGVRIKGANKTGNGVFTIDRVVLRPDLNLTEADITKLPVKNINFSPLAGATVSTLTPYRVQVNYNTGTTGASGVSLSFDDFQTLIKETEDLSGLQSIVVRVYHDQGTPLTVELKYGVNNSYPLPLVGTGPTWQDVAIPLSLFQGADMTQTAELVVQRVGGPNETGVIGLEIRQQTFPLAEVQPTAAITMLTDSKGNVQGYWTTYGNQPVSYAYDTVTPPVDGYYWVKLQVDGTKTQGFVIGFDNPYTAAQESAVLDTQADAANEIAGSTTPNHYIGYVNFHPTDPAVTSMTLKIEMEEDIRDPQTGVVTIQHAPFTLTISADTDKEVDLNALLQDRVHSNSVARFKFSVVAPTGEGIPGELKALYGASSTTAPPVVGKSLGQLAVQPGAQLSARDIATLAQINVLFAEGFMDPSIQKNNPELAQELLEIMFQGQLKGNKLVTSIAEAARKNPDSLGALLIARKLDPKQLDPRVAQDEVVISDEKSASMIAMFETMVMNKKAKALIILTSGKAKRHEIMKTIEGYRAVVGVELNNIKSRIHIADSIEDAVETKLPRLMEELKRQGKIENVCAIGSRDILKELSAIDPKQQVVYVEAPNTAAGQVTGYFLASALAYYGGFDNLPPRLKDFLKRTSDNRLTLSDQVLAILNELDILRQGEEKAAQAA